jgi:hypothetical protein
MRDVSNTGIQDTSQRENRKWKKRSSVHCTVCAQIPDNVLSLPSQDTTDATARGRYYMPCMQLQVFAAQPNSLLLIYWKIWYFLPACLFPNRETEEDTIKDKGLPLLSSMFENWDPRTSQGSGKVNFDHSAKSYNKTFIFIIDLCLLPFVNSGTLDLHNWYIGYNDNKFWGQRTRPCELLGL